MTDPELIAKKQAHIESCVQQLRSMARPEAIESDVREERFVEHTLQLAIQAALDVASHVVSDERLGEPASNRELFLVLERGGWLESSLGESLQRMAGFRDILVHGYADVDLAVVRDVVENRLGDLEAFVASIRARMAS